MEKPPKGLDEDEHELAVQFEHSTSCWQCLGDANAPARSEAEQEVYTERVWKALRLRVLGQSLN